MLILAMKVVFIDRDGVINKSPGDRLYVTSLGSFRFLPRSKKAISLLSKNEFKVFVVSNQAGVGNGAYSQKTLDNITIKMLNDIRQDGGKIDKVYYCTHRKDIDCSCHKPKPGMLEQAAKEFKFDLEEAYFIGDTIIDVLTAQAAGCKSILVLTGKEKLANQKDWEAEPDFIFKDLFEAAKFLVC
jgi:D-glycero-D-manno-heptose 1,7-bisphosphate phosphatase